MEMSSSSDCPLEIRYSFLVGNAGFISSAVVPGPEELVPLET